MKNRIRLSPEELRLHLASEVESIRSEIEQLRIAAERINGETASAAGTTPLSRISREAHLTHAPIHDFQEVSQG
jgi:hypothetical protein